MSFAIIETGGKQYKVSASNILKVEKLNIVKGKKVEFKKVLLVNDDKNTEVGNPTVEGALVEGLVLDNIKDRKILVFKKRRRQNIALKLELALFSGGFPEMTISLSLTRFCSKSFPDLSFITPTLSGFVSILCLSHAIITYCPIYTCKYDTLPQRGKYSNLVKLYDN